MNPYAVFFLALMGILLIGLPRRWAPLPLLMGACYMTQSQGVDLGPYYFSVLRILILIAIARMTIRLEWRHWVWNRLDTVFVSWALWALMSALWHSDPSDALVFRLGLVYDYLGIYFTFRSFIREHHDLIHLGKLVSLVLVPVAIGMGYEKLASHNLFSYFGGVPEVPVIREGHIRAQGPFRHAILAGTVGAAMFPWAVAVWRDHRLLSLLGATSCVIMVMACRSSGPIGGFLAGILGLLLWSHRSRMRQILRLALAGYVLLDLLMKAPAYYLMARIDFAGGSTGWHRAYLIETSINHLNEWWFAGTDYTRHWMPTGVSWSPDHSDITNHYIEMGVIGGLPLLVLFVFVLASGFRNIGLKVRGAGADIRQAFGLWAVGSSLFSYAVSSIGVSYFDQSFLFLCVTLATTGLTESRVSENSAS